MLTAKDKDNNMGAKPEKIVARVLGAGVMLLALGAAGVVCCYLTEYGVIRFMVALGLVALGAGVAVVIDQRLSRHCTTRRRLRVVLALTALLVLIPLGSLVYPGRITYARFGLTVYGVVPVPFFDLTINSHGVPWFRAKSHRVTLKEVKSLLEKDDTELVIGVGWDRMVEIDPEVANMGGVLVHALSTPQALARYRALVAEGTRVVLILHTTC